MTRGKFLKLADHIAGWSKDPSTKVGAVIVDRDRRIISTGFNGFPLHLDDTPERLNNRELKYQMILHAEENAILLARRSVEGCTLYVTHPPCPHCASAIIQAKIQRVICYKPTPDYMERWAEKVQLTGRMFDEAEIRYEHQ